MTAVDEQTYYAKLQAIRDIKGRTITLDKLKNRIFREIENTDVEEKSLAEYRREMELLLQEKMSHVEELRQIHADINALEGVIKQAEENRARSLGIANKIHEEYLPLKNEIDHMRREYLGLSPIPDLHEEEGSIITAEYSTLLKKLYDLRLKQNNSIFSRFQTSASYNYPSAIAAASVAAAAAANNKLSGGGGGVGGGGGGNGGGVGGVGGGGGGSGGVGNHTITASPSSSSGFSRPPLTGPHHSMILPPEATVTSLPPSSVTAGSQAPTGFLPPPPNHGPMRINQKSSDLGGGVGGPGGGGGGGGGVGGGGGGGGPTRLQQSPSIGMAHPTFRSEFNVNLRQQPPPMKSCLSCHQQIHRNAPICPLCKAKSRSRNPKKPKKKDH